MNLSGSGCGVVVDARRAGLNFSETADLLGASSTAIPRVYRDYSQKIKYSVSDSSRGKNAL